MRSRRQPNPANKVYESNGPDVKVRGTPQQIVDKYMQLGRDALSAGDTVKAENYFQHAEHYLRIITAAQEQMQARRQQQEQRRQEAAEQRKGNGVGSDAPAALATEEQPTSEGAEVVMLPTEPTSAVEAADASASDTVQQAAWGEAPPSFLTTPVDMGAVAATETVSSEGVEEASSQAATSKDTPSADTAAESRKVVRKRRSARKENGANAQVTDAEVSSTTPADGDKAGEQRDSSAPEVG